MLSIGKLGSAASAASYYRADDYYGRDGGADAPSSWFGKGARAAGLTGAVGAAAFGAAMDGRVPGGPVLGRIVDGERQHAAGWDLTFSAPKSVSVYEALLGKDELRTAHREAVASALDWVEQSVEVRVWDAAQRRQVNVGGQGAVIATFEHDLSRAQDPQLHTHCVVANMAMGEDGQWRSVHSPALFRDKMLLGAVYRSELAANLSERGLLVERTGRHGGFEITGFDPSVARAFSTRRSEIEDRLASRNETGAKASADAALATRQSKGRSDPTELRQRWDEAVAAAGRDLAADYALASAEQTAPTYGAARDAVTSAANHLSERQSSFSERDLLRHAMAFGTGSARPSQIENATRLAVRASELIEATGRDGQRVMTTEAALAAERAVLSIELEGRGRANPLARQPMVEKRMEGRGLTAGQVEVVRTAVLSCDRTVGVQGYAGTGKTTALRTVAELAKANGYAVKGLAPSHQAAAALADGAGIDTQTVQRWVLREGSKAEVPDLSRTLVIVDESSMLATGLMRDLLEITEAGAAARVLLVGDTAQLKAVEAGTPFAALQAAGMPTVRMEEIVRQRSPDHLQAVEASVRGEVAAALRTMDGILVETEPRGMAEQAARSWLAGSREDREQTGIVVPTHALRRQVTAHVRDGLKAEGRLSGPASVVNVASPIRLTREELRHAASYEAGVEVRFTRDYKRLGVEKGDRFLVAGSDQRTGRVTLETEKGDRWDWVPARLGAAGVELNDNRSVELMPGDAIRFTSNDRDGRFVNGDRGDYLGFAKGVHAFDVGGKRLSLQPNDEGLRALDHDYAHTGHAFQGRTVDRAILVMDSQNALLSTKQALYVGLSRARDGVTFVTDDREQLTGLLERQSDGQLSASDVARMAERGSEHARSIATPPAPDPGREPADRAGTEASSKSFDGTEFGQADGTDGRSKTLNPTVSGKASFYESLRAEGAAALAKLEAEARRILGEEPPPQDGPTDGDRTSAPTNTSEKAERSDRDDRDFEMEM